MELTFETWYEDDKVIKSALVKNNDCPDKRYYFSFPKWTEEKLTDRADPFLMALIFELMETGGKIQIQGEVSFSLIKNLENFSRIWHHWFPKKYKEISLQCKIAPDDYRPENRNLVTAFSGGLDASYTTYKFKNHLDKVNDFDLKLCVLIWGADIPLESKEDFSKAYDDALAMTSDLDVPLAVVETNIRQNLKNWEMMFGSVVAGILCFFSKECFYGTASDYSAFVYHIPWGMNPITDPLLSSDTFRYFVDGIYDSRTDRANLIKDWTVGLEKLRVCWQNDDKSKNCGHCEKCIRTMLNFKVVGLDRLPSMPHSVSLEQIKDKRFSLKPNVLPFYVEILNYGKRNGTLSEEWVKALQDKIKEAKNQSVKTRIVNILRLIKHKVIL